MQRINLETWPRRQHFDMFKAFDYPHFNMCANVDITAFYPLVKARGASFTVAVMYLVARTANAIPQFRQRIIDDQPVEYEVVHPSGTILVGDELFSFCIIEYTPDFTDFVARANQQIARVRQNLTLDEPPGMHNLLFMSAIPWVSFTSFLNPMHLSPADSVPRFAWGKFFREGSRLKMPLSVQGHHALMDGLHIGHYYAKIQEDLEYPESFLDPVSPA